ncbi:MAG: ABC transporter substrate-binding protein [Treponema sp.]|jgi:peptide/nickel transport system substrate-binding protein|nr:ABC transporter substrate-binding protein [Treponema sp.]
MTKKAFFRYLIFALMGMAFSGCSEKQADQNAAPAPLVVAITGFDTKNFDPSTAMVILSKYVLSAVYESLVETNENGQYQPALAESYVISEDYRTVTLKIRPGVVFHDGSPLTAADVVFSFEKYSKPGSINGVVIQTFIDRVEQLDEYTVSVHTKRPYPFVLYAIGSVSILPKNYVEEKGDDYFSTHPIGTGPYRVADIDQDVAVSLEAAPDYWGESPEYKTMIVKNIPDASTQLAMLKAGEADIVQISTDNIPEIRGTPGLSIKNLEKTTMTTVYVQGAWEDRGEASQNLLVRQALDYAINRKEIVDDFFDGYAIPEKYWKVSPTGENWDPSWTATEYDPQRAKELLARAGYPDKFRQPVIRFYTFAGDWRSKLAELIASYWEAVGLQVEIHPTDETILMTFARGSPDLSDEAYGAVCLWSSPVGVLDGISSQEIWYRTNGRISVIRNFPEIDAWFDEALSSFDINKRNEIDNRVLRKVDDELKYIFGIAYVDSLWGVSGKVGTWLADEWEDNLGGFSAAYYKTIRSAGPQ